MTDATARHGDPSTSHDAAARMSNSKLEEAVYQWLWHQWPLYRTSLEIATGMGVDKWSISPRLRPLRRKGHLDPPIKRPGLNSNGIVRELQAWRVKR